MFIHYKPFPFRPATADTESDTPGLGKQQAQEELPKPSENALDFLLSIGTIMIIL